MQSSLDHNILIYSQKGLDYRKEYRFNMMKELYEKKLREKQISQKILQDELDQSYINCSSKLLNNVSVFLTRNASNVSNDMPQKLMIAVSNSNQIEQKQAINQLMLQSIDESNRNNKYVQYKVDEYSQKLVRPIRWHSSSLSQSEVNSVSRNQRSQFIFTNNSYDNSLNQSQGQRSISPNLQYQKCSNQNSTKKKSPEQNDFNLYSPEKIFQDNQNDIYSNQRCSSLQQSHSNNKRSQSNEASIMRNPFNCYDESILSKKYSLIINAENKIQKMIQKYNKFDDSYKKTERKIKNKNNEQKDDLDGSLAQSPNIRDHIENDDLLEVLLKKTNYKLRKEQRIILQQEQKYGKQWQNLYLPKIPNRYQNFHESIQKNPQQNLNEYKIDKQNQKIFNKKQTQQIKVNILNRLAQKIKINHS